MASLLLFETFTPTDATTLVGLHPLATKKVLKLEHAAVD